jgi:hypothetical protein
MAKSEKKCFVVQIPLNLEKFQIDFLNKKLEDCRKVYNTVLSITLKRYKEMQKTKKYKYIEKTTEKYWKPINDYKNQIDELNNEVADINELLKNNNLSNEEIIDLNNKKKDIAAQIKTLIAEKKKLNDEFKLIKPEFNNIKNGLLKEYHISKYGFDKDIRKVYSHFNIPSKTAESIRDDIWRAYDKNLWGNGKRFHFKRYNTVDSINGSSNNQTVKLDLEKNCVTYMKKDYPIKFPKNNNYIIEALNNNKIIRCRIVRKSIKKKDRFFVQATLNGTPPTNYNRLMGNGKVGIDIGTQTIAVVGKNDIKLEELAKGVQDIQNQLRIINRKMDRSRRATNPDNYNEDGTIVKVKKGEKRNWHYSKNYKKLAAERKELFRKQVDLRKLSHETLANEIIGMGDEFYIEDMEFQALQKKAKETTKNSKGKFNSKKRFGKSIANKAPAMAKSILKRKLGYYGKELIEIKTKKAKASQYNHVDNTYIKAELSVRSKDIGGHKIQRDLYSAFLISNINPDLETFNRVGCNIKFDNFCKMHDKKIIELKNDDSIHNLSSLGLKDFSEK